MGIRFVRVIGFGWLNGLSPPPPRSDECKIRFVTKFKPRYGIICDLNEENKTVDVNVRQL